jgi:hypothetical protein
MTLLAALVARIREKLSRRKGFAEKRMFGVGFLCNSNLCLGAWQGSLIVRLALSLHTDTLRAGFRGGNSLACTQPLDRQRREPAPLSCVLGETP